MIFSTGFAVSAHIVVSAMSGSMASVLALYLPLAAFYGAIIGCGIGIAAFGSMAGARKMGATLWSQRLASSIIAGLVGGSGYAIAWSMFWRPGPPSWAVAVAFLAVFVGFFLYWPSGRAPRSRGI